jgi:Cdc6-like AAA superfamily ATPase
MQSKSSTPSTIKILVVGKTGDGKTSFINNLAKLFNESQAGKFIPSAGTKSDTQEINTLQFCHPTIE